MRKRLSLVAINVLLFLVLAECAAVVVYYAQHGRLFYTAEKAVPPALAETSRGELSGDVLHPYFGPIHRPGVRPETNNIGFGSKQAFPFARTSDRQFLVGIFGGSVARAFCDRGTPRLIDGLRRDPALANREIVPLCFSHEGYKQPQQLLRAGVFPLDRTAVRSGRQHRRLQRGGALEPLNHAARPRHLDAERHAPRSARQPGRIRRR